MNLVPRTYMKYDLFGFLVRDPFFALFSTGTAFFSRNTFKTDMGESDRMREKDHKFFFSIG